MSSSSRPRLVALAVALVIVTGSVAAFLWLGRSDPMDWTAPHTAPHAQGVLDASFHAPDLDSYYSGQVIEPAPESWTRVRPSSDYRVLLLAAGKDAHTALDPQVKVLVDAVRKWEGEESRVQLKTRYLADPDTYIQRLDDAAQHEHADLIITAGNDLVEPVAVTSANYAGYHPQQFLVLGAEVAEPTTNIAATNWEGSAYIGEGLKRSLFYDPAAVTAPRAYAALRAGVAAVLSGYTSVIVRIPSDHY